jgi:stage V sporulation protein S
MDETTSELEDVVFKVKASANPLKLGSAIAHTISAGGSVELRAIGAGAVNQAMKSIPIAKSFVASYGITLLADPTFFHGEVKEGDIQGLAIRVFKVKA